MKPLSTILATIVAALVCASATNSSAQNLVQNGGFETGTFSPWTFTDPSNNTNIGSSATFAFEGTRYANLGADPGTGVLSQTINTVPGSTYTFSFSLAVDQTFIPGDPAPANFFQALFDGNAVYTQSNLPGDENGGPYMSLSFPVVATGNTALVEFRYQHNNDFFRLDGVSVVPEPSTVSLIAISAVGGLLCVYRRSRRTA